MTAGSATIEALTSTDGFAFDVSISGAGIPSEPVEDWAHRAITRDVSWGIPVPEDLDPDKLMRPAASRDSKFFWDGVDAHELRIQRRPDGTLQHPPVPALWQDHTAPIDYVVSSGNGTVYSFVVHHAPKVPGRTLPFVIALVELDEGVRMLGELRGVDPATVEIGMPVRATYIDIPDSATGPAWTLYAWEPQQ